MFGSLWVKLALRFLLQLWCLCYCCRMLCLKHFQQNVFSPWGAFCSHALLKLQNSKEITCEYRLVWESEFSGVGKWATGDFKVVLQVKVGLVLGHWNLQPNPFARSMIPYYYRCLSTAKSQFWFWELLEITFLIQKSFAFFFFLVNWMYKASKLIRKEKKLFPFRNFMDQIQYFKTWRTKIKLTPSF